MDTHVFANLAQIRILLVPIGAIPQQTFEKYASEIRSFDAIRLGDIAVEGTKDERGMWKWAGYNPLALTSLISAFSTQIASHWISAPQFPFSPTSALAPSPIAATTITFSARNHWCCYVLSLRSPARNHLSVP